MSIDDLIALEELLNSMSDVDDDVRISFNGGFVDTASDITSLSDLELKRLKFETSKGMVEFSLTEAFVKTRDRMFSDAVAAWASKRINKPATRAIWIRSWLPFYVFGVGLWVTGVFALQDLSADNPVMFWFDGAIMAACLGSIFILGGTDSFAIILPVPMTEARTVMWSQRGQRQTYWLTILSIGIAGAAIIIPLIAGK